MDYRLSLRIAGNDRVELRVLRKFVVKQDGRGGSADERDVRSLRLLRVSPVVIGRLSATEIPALPGAPHDVRYELENLRIGGKVLGLLAKSEYRQLRNIAGAID